MVQSRFSLRAYPSEPSSWSPAGVVRHSMRDVPFQFAALVHSSAPVAANARPVSAPARGATRSKVVLASTPGAKRQRFRNPMEASASRPLKASRARYSENSCPLRR